MQREIRLFRSCYTLPLSQNLKPTPAGTSELITFGANSDLRWNCPAGTSEFLPFGANSDLAWDWKIPEIPYRGLIFAFAGTSELILFGANSDLCWNFNPGTSELIPFGASSDIPWDLGFPEIPSWRFLFAFPRWGLLCLSVRGELHIFPLGFYYDSTLLGNYMDQSETGRPKFNDTAYTTTAPFLLEKINFQGVMKQMRIRHHNLVCLFWHLKCNEYFPLIEINTSVAIIQPGLNYIKFSSELIWYKSAFT